METQGPRDKEKRSSALKWHTQLERIASGEGCEMSKRLQRLTFLIICLLLSWIWVKTSCADEEDAENENDITSIFSVKLSATKSRKAKCQRPNPDDPRGEILKGVYCPIRLKVMDKNNPVRKFVGVLIGKHRATDGDLTFDVVPYEEYRYLINESNLKERNGALHCEIVPHDRAKFESIFDRMRLKSVVEVGGVWVEDTHHENWRELHPVESLMVLNTMEVKEKSFRLRTWWRKCKRLFSTLGGFLRHLNHI
jgi:hypothetical protein